MKKKIKVRIEKDNRDDKEEIERKKLKREKGWRQIGELCGGRLKG